MPKNPAPSPTEGSTRTPRILLLPLCFCLMASSGCLVRKRPAAHLGTILLAPPVIPSSKTEEALNQAPDLELEPAPLPAQLGLPRDPPARPRVPAIHAAEPATAEKPSELTIAPELSAAELQAAKAAAQASLDAAERNLAATQGKALNETQMDLVSKIRGFMDATREAMGSGDWERATNMAKKAEVLSEELAEGL